MTLTVFDKIISDRGSRYAVSGGPATTRAEVEALLTELKANKRFAKATHNTWACVFSDAGPVKNDDGEAGAGAVIIGKRRDALPMTRDYMAPVAAVGAGPT